MSTNEPTFQEIYDTFHPKILRYMTRLVGEPEAEDLTQEVFVKVSKALEGFRGESQLSTWIYRIATNAALDKLREPSFRQASQSGSLDTFDRPPGDVEEEIDEQNAWSETRTPSVEQQLVRQEMNECIQGFIEGLPESYRTVLVLSELEGLKNKEIADILGLTLNTVKIRLHRARERLKEALEANCGFYWIEENEFVPNLKNILEGPRKRQNN